MRRLLVVASLVLALIIVPSTAAHAGQSTHTRLFAGAGRATLVADPDTGAFTIDGQAIVTQIGLARLHSEGQFTGSDTFELSSTFTGKYGTITTTTTGQTTALSDTDARFTNHDQVIGGTGRFAGATGKSITIGISHSENEDGTISSLAFVFAGPITF